MGDSAQKMVKSIYLSWFEAFGIGVILLVGGFYWKETGDNHILGYIIMLSVVYLFFVLFLNERKLRLKTGQDLQKTHQKYVEVADLIASEIGWRYNQYKSKSEIHMDGSTKVIRTIELEALKGVVASVDYRSLSAPGTVVGYDIETSKISGVSDISVEILERTSTTTRFLLRFIPPLKEGDKITYEMKEEYGKGRHPMTLDEIADFMKKGKWLYDEPYDYKTVLVKYPTMRLVVAVILPASHKITTAEDFFDVRVGFWGGGRHIEEYERTSREGCFSKEIIADKQVLRLVVDDPKIALSYGIKWKPPSKKDLKKLVK